MGKEPSYKPRYCGFCGSDITERHSLVRFCCEECRIWSKRNLYGYSDKAIQLIKERLRANAVS